MDLEQSDISQKDDGKMLLPPAWLTPAWLISNEHLHLEATAGSEF
jgi:hypothetical protein